MRKTNWKNRLILICIIIISSFNLYSIEVSYNREEQIGLSYLYITDIVKDHKGFMWFGTTKGLNRWDGYKYKHYLSDKNDNTTISNNNIQTLLLDKDEFIWVGTSNGLNRYDSKSDQFTHFLNNPNDESSISSNNIFCIEEDHNGNLWIGTDNGINFYNKTTEKFQKFEIKNIIESENNYNSIRILFCDSKNGINVGFTYSGILRINADNFTSEFNLFDVEGNYISSVNDIVQIDDNNLLLGTWGGKAFTYSINQKEINKWDGNKLINSDVIDHIIKDQNGNYWISDKYNQIVHVSSDFGLIDRFSTSSKYNYIPSNQITCVFNDDENIWFGTSHGFFQIRHNQKPIKTLNWETYGLPELNNLKITSIATGRPGEIIFGTSNSELIILNENINTIKRIPIKNKVAYRIYYDKYRNKIFYGSNSSSLNSIDLTTFQEKNDSIFPSNYTQYGITSNDSIILFATWGNGLSIKYNDGRIEQQGSSVMEKSFSTLNFALDEDKLWLATLNNGLLRFNLKTKKFKSFLFENQSSSLLPTNQVIVVTRLKNGDILISSNELGLCYFNQAEEKFIQVGKEIGINDINIKSIVEDKNQNIWIVSERKIIKTNAQFNELTEYTIYDGIDYGIEHLAAAISDQNEYIYIGGQQGIQYFQTNDLQQDTSTNKVIITDFKIFEKPLAINSNALNGISISYKDSITLSHKENFITIDFSSMQFNNQTNREFSYKLTGVNNDWVTVPYHQNSVTYSNLSPGNYLFEVKVSNEHGKWLNESTKFNIIITPPFWLTSWFRFIILVFIVTVIATFIRLREYNLVQDKKKLEFLVRDRTSELRKQKSKVEFQNMELEHANNIKNKFFNIIAHDLRNPIGSMVQLTDLLKENYSSFDEEQLSEIIHSTSNSANSTMELLEDLLVWASSQTDRIKLDIQPFNIYSITKSEAINLNQQAKNKNISILNRIPDNINVLADVNSVKTIIRNLLSNAIKFSNRNSSIIIQSTIESTFLKVSIIDTGVGIPYTKIKKLFEMDEKNSTIGTEGERGTGLGLNLCYEFAKRNGGELKVESTLGEGSEFSFTLALSTNS